MNAIVYLAIALGIVAVAAPAVFYRIGRKSGRETEEIARRAAGEAAEQVAKRITTDAERDADGLRKQAVLAGKEEAMKAREAWETEARRRREEVASEEKRVQEREVTLDRKLEIVETRDKELGRRASEIGRKEKTVDERQQELDKMVGEERRRLEQLAGLSAQEAKAELIRRMEEEAQADAANRLREIRDTAKRTPTARRRRSSHSPSSVSRPTIPPKSR